MTFELFVLVLFEPLKSADPPINWGKIVDIFSITVDEHCRVAIAGFVSKDQSKINKILGYPILCAESNLKNFLKN